MKRIILHLMILAYQKSANRQLIEEDVEHWCEVLKWEGDYKSCINRLLREKQEYRNLFYYRLGGIRVLSKLFNIFFPPLPTLYIWTPNIGGGLFIQHGFATVIAAKEIGRHCFVNQQVTIGYKGDDAPIICDDVTVTCGAKIIGGVVVGNSSIIGANAVVVKDVPENSTVIGVPGRIVKRNGLKCYE